MIIIIKHIANLIHLSAMIFLLQEILKKKNCIGLSYRTQQIYLIVFLARYSSVFFSVDQKFYLLLKIIFILLTSYTIYLIRFKKPYCITYDKTLDKFPHHLFIYPAALILTILFHVKFQNHQIYQYLWSFSIILEAFAIIPQIYVQRRSQYIEVFTHRFIICLGLYRLLYIFYWCTELILYSQFLNIFFGLIQTLLFSDLIYKYFKQLKRQNHIKIPI